MNNNRRILTDTNRRYADSANELVHALCDHNNVSLAQPPIWYIALRLGAIGISLLEQILRELESHRPRSKQREG